MTDPYKVLGVSPSASDDEIKKAYREQARKYHPDNYHDNPLSDLAQDKMKQINEAYDSILRMRGGGSNGGGTYSQGGYTYSSNSGGGGGQYAQIRMMIQMGQIQQAEQMLNAMSNRDAQWHFLMGGVCYRKGWLDQARQHMEQAARMEPNNREYQQAVEQMRSGGFAYRGGHGMAGGMDMCDCCTALMCLNCMCR